MAAVTIKWTIVVVKFSQMLEQPKHLKSTRKHRSLQLQSFQWGQSAGKTFMINLYNVPVKIGYYLSGFADGEGNFNVVFRPREDFKIPWKISLCFNISQKDKVILALYKRHLKCGTLRSRKDGVWYFEVNNLIAIKENVIPFFDKFGFLSAKKKRDFAKFKKLAEIILKEEHKTPEGIVRILKIRKDMNDGGKRKYQDEEILKKIKESSETKR